MADLTQDELEFWKDTFKSADLGALIAANDGLLPPQGLAHMSAEHASAAVRELRRVIAEGV